MKLSREDIITKLKNGSLQEVTEFGLELKSNWDKSFGKKICGIANQPSREGGWLVIGASDAGELLGEDSKWLTQTEQTVSSHIAHYLTPDFSVVNIKGELLEGGAVLLIDIVSVNEVVRWDDSAYKLIGTSCSAMSQSEVLDLASKLPGSDFSKMEYLGQIDDSMVIDFAKKIESNGKFEEDFQISDSTVTQLLSKLHISNKKAAGILFGDFNVRVIFYNEDDDILSKQDKKGVYSILRDSFIEEVQNWTRSKTPDLNNTIASSEEVPYPTKSLREVIANAVAHAKYTSSDGGIIIELYPRRITVSNNCNLDAKFFVNKWFSKAHKTSNSLLMECLKMAGISDELGSGKRRIFRTQIERGKREPIIGFQEYDSYATWSITLYNDEANVNLLKLIERLKETFSNADERRIATALVLWKDKEWSEIQECLDEHYKNVAKTVIKSRFPPVSVINEKLYLKRWITVALEGAVTKKFSASEENSFKDLLNTMAFIWDDQGYITFDDIRRHIGMSNTKVENAQLSSLLNKWSKEGGVIEKVEKKRGEWKFLNPPVKE